MTFWSRFCLSPPSAHSIFCELQEVTKISRQGGEHRLLIRINTSYKELAYTSAIRRWKWYITIRLSHTWINKWEDWQHFEYFQTRTRPSRFTLQDNTDLCPLLFEEHELCKPFRTLLIILYVIYVRVFLVNCSKRRSSMCIGHLVLGGWRRRNFNDYMPREIHLRERKWEQDSI